MVKHIADNAEHKQEYEEVSRRGSGFESGWYIPGIVDPALKKLELDEEEERQALPAKEFYELLKRLTSQEVSVASDPSPEQSDDSDE